MNTLCQQQRDVITLAAGVNLSMPGLIRAVRNSWSSRDLESREDLFCLQ